MATKNKVTQVERLADKTLLHMESYHAGSQQSSLLLAGDPGIGKTTFVNMFGMLVGMNVITIEIPHITEEHMINIPFIVFNPLTNTTKTDRLVLTDESGGAKSDKESQYKLVLAQSNLYTQLINSPPIPDAKYLETILKAPADIQRMYANLGGTAEKIPAEIASVRGKYKTILFLDEFFRSTSMRIRNILRGILNHQIGMHRIPKNAYIIYASNMRDTAGTIGEFPTNYDFQKINYKAPSKEEWFDWLEAKCESKYKIELNKSVMTKFKKTLKDQDISFTDMDIEGGVRTSPRRWEQILLYVNSSLPAKDRKEAQALLTNIKNNFLHYSEGKHSKLAEKVVAAVADLIQETSGFEINPKETLPTTDWKTQLGHMLDQQKKLGKLRTHIPVISGPPGIGKTSFAQDVALKHGLLLIDVDCSKLTPDDVIGLPIPGNKVDPDKPDIKVQFAVPTLYEEIMRKIHEREEEHFESLKQTYPNEYKEKVQAFKDQKYKYLLFFDELNRPEDPRTFNGLRKVMLDKDFGPAGQEHGEPLKLPQGSIIVAAINPVGTGTNELTEHFRDVSDFIPADAHWSDFRRWMAQQKKKDFEKAGPQVTEAAIRVIDEFVNKFKAKGDFPTEQAPFNLELGGQQAIYVSPREYMAMFATLVRYLHRTITKLLRDPDVTVDELRDGVDEATFDAIEESLDFSTEKANIGEEAQDIMQKLRLWVQNIPPNVFGGLLTTKLRHHQSLSSVLESYLDGHNLEKMPEDAHFTNLNNSVDNGEIIDQFRNLIDHAITGADDVKKYILTPTQGKIQMVNGKLTKNPGEKVPLLENFARTLIYTLHILEFTNERVQIIGKAINNAIGRLRDNLEKSGKFSEDISEQFEEQTVKLRMSLQKLYKEL